MLPPAAGEASGLLLSLERALSCYSTTASPIAIKTQSHLEDNKGRFSVMKLLCFMRKTLEETTDNLRDKGVQAKARFHLITRGTHACFCKRNPWKHQCVHRAKEGTKPWTEVLSNPFAPSSFEAKAPGLYLYQLFVRYRSGNGRAYLLTHFTQHSS